ncbi:MAG: hypothetical protein ACREF3_18175 [Acetobacteraceae bacterium]
MSDMRKQPTPVQRSAVPAGTITPDVAREVERQTGATIVPATQTTGGEIPHAELARRLGGKA